MSDIPDGADFSVVAMAIAWAMAKQVGYQNYGKLSNNGPEAVLDAMIAGYVKAYKTVLKAANDGGETSG